MEHSLWATRPKALSHARTLHPLRVWVLKTLHRRGNGGLRLLSDLPKGAQHVRLGAGTQAGDYSDLGGRGSQVPGKPGKPSQPCLKIKSKRVQGCGSMLEGPSSITKVPQEKKKRDRSVMPKSIMFPLRCPCCHHHTDTTLSPQRN